YSTGGSRLFAWVSWQYGIIVVFFFFQAEDGIRDFHVTGVQTCALPISFSAKASITLRSTIARLVAVHFCPAKRIAPLTTMSAALSRSASASTIAAFLPPISSWYLMPRAAASWAMWEPTALEPVKVTALTASWLIR